METSGSDCKRITSKEECKHAKEELGLRTGYNDANMGGQPSSGHFGPNNILGCWFARDNLDGSLYFNTNVDSYGQCGRSYGNGIASCICRVWALWLIIKANFQCTPYLSPSQIQFNPTHVPEMRHPVIHVAGSFLYFRYFLSFCLITLWLNKRRHNPLFSVSQLLFV